MPTKSLQKLELCVCGGGGGREGGWSRDSEGSTFLQEEMSMFQVLVWCSSLSTENKVEQKQYPGQVHGLRWEDM